MIDQGCTARLKIGTRIAVLHHSAEMVLCFRNHVLFPCVVLCCFLKVSAAGKDDLPMV